MLFGTITLRDLTKPIRQRHHAHCGPYTWTPAEPNKGRGFYQASSSYLRCGDSTFDLRLDYANDHLSGTRLAQINGYYCDEYQDQTLIPIVARLPRGRGFLAGWTMGAGMLATLDCDIYETAEDAARGAHSEAEHAALWMIEDDEKQRRELDAEEALAALESGAP